MWIKRSRIAAGVLAALLIATVACGRPDPASPTEQAQDPGGEASASAAPPESGKPAVASTSGGGAPSTYLAFNQHWLEGLAQNELDLDDVDAVFWHIFSRLEDDVIVYPSENYYYFLLYTNQKQLQGNIRLPAGRRENGVLSFAYTEFRESPFVLQPRAGRSKFFTDADGVKITELDRFTWNVRYKGKDVRFHLNQLSQEPPKLFSLAEDEVFIERTFDESGYQFFLVFGDRDDYFLWILNEEEPIADTLQPLGDGLLVGRRSGFAFLIDEAHDNRKILIAIRGQNATRNDYFDGPFDQLADNYVDEVGIAEYMVKASPSLRGRIDKYGYFTDRARSSRVAISPYWVYYTEPSLMSYVANARASEDLYLYIATKGAMKTPATAARAAGSTP